MSHRRDQTASVLHKAVQEVLTKGFHDPRIRGLLTVTRVDPSPDLRNAKVYVSVMPKEHEDLTLHGLRDASAHIRRRVGELVRMRTVPQLTFRADLGMRRQSEVFTALSRVEEERRRASGDQEDAPASEEN